MKLLVTGGAGFIGSNFLHRIVPRHPDLQFLALDALTYAGNLENISALDTLPHYDFVRCDLSDAEQTRAVFHEFRPDVVLHLAAESHVDRSIQDPGPCLQSNVLGTFQVLEACRALHAQGHPIRLVHVSTDEVFGSLEPEAPGATESSPYKPRNPYAASKAAADHLARAWMHTYGLPVIVTHCSNNYGPRQFPEKLIPFMLLRAMGVETLPLYGDGLNRRDWLYVDDHCDGLWAAITHGQPGSTYLFSAEDERPNLEVVHQLCQTLEQLCGYPPGVLQARITFIPDRPGHDKRYALHSHPTRQALHWSPSTPFAQGLKQTVQWYLDHPQWLDHVESGAYRHWVSTHYPTPHSLLPPRVGGGS